MSRGVCNAFKAPVQSTFFILTFFFLIRGLSKLQFSKEAGITHQITEKETASWIQSQQADDAEYKHKKLLLFCYMRGGSTYLSRFFRDNPQVTFWYEPLAPFYMAKYGTQKWIYPQDVFWRYTSDNNFRPRIIPGWETKAKATYSHNLFSCNISGLPVETLAHTGLKHTTMSNALACQAKTTDNFIGDTCHRKYLKRHCNTPTNRLNITCANNINKVQERIRIHNGSSDDALKDFTDFVQCRNKFYYDHVKACEYIFRESCHNSEVVVYKGLRLKMQEVREMLHTDPDMKVVYMVRDPRSIVASREQAGFLYKGSNNDSVLEASYLCAKMMDDLRDFRALESGIHKNVKLVRYEDIMVNTETIIRGIYRSLNQDINPRIKQKFLMSNDHFAKVQINKWRDRIPVEKHQPLTEACKDVLHELGYTVN